MALDFLELSRLYWDKAVPVLPADVGLFRVHVETRAALYKYILEQIQTNNDCYYPFYTPLISKYWPEEKKREAIVTALFVDIDVRQGDVFQDIWSKTEVFLSKFYPNLDLYFSSGKGFHMTVYINPVTYGELHDNRERLYWVMSTWFQYLHDKRAFLSLDRICRLPFTPHHIDPENPTPLRWKVPIAPDLTIDQILQKSEHPQEHTDEFYSLYQRQLAPIDYRIFLESPDTLLKE